MHVLATRVHADRPLRHLPAHHTHNVSSTTILQTAVKASIFTAQHNTPSYIPASRRISSTCPQLLYTCTHAHVHLQASSPASTCPLPELCRVRTRRASHGQLPNHASTGSQSSTLKSTRSTFQSPDRLWVLSPTDSPLHLASMLHFSRV